MAETSPRIIIDKPVAMVDEEIRISVVNLQPFQRVTITTAVEEDTSKFISYAHFIADANGSVNVDRQPALSGCYVGIHGMGLFWSMIPATGHKIGSKMWNKDVQTPKLYHLLVTDGFTSVNDLNEVTQFALCTAVLERWYLASDTTREVVRSGRVRGTLFYPKSGKSYPGLIEIQGGPGGLLEYKAALLASHGYASFAVAYANYDDLPTEFNFDYDYFDDVIKFMLNHKGVDASQGLSVFGICSGAEIAMHIASYHAEIKLCISVGSNHYYSRGFHTYKGRSLRVGDLDWTKVNYTENGLIFRGIYKDQTGSDLIPVQNSTAFFLIQHGTDDKVYDYTLAIDLEKRICLAGGNCKLELYPGTGHIIEPIYTPLYRCMHYAPYGLFECGGDTRLHAMAQERSWNSILSRLKVVFHNSYQRIGRIPLSKL